jgi:Animal haem peroxidase
MNGCPHRMLAMDRNPTGERVIGLGQPPGQRSRLRRAWSSVATFIDQHVIAWHRLPTLPGLMVLIGIRDRLRDRNLADRSVDRLAGAALTRSPDGSLNQLTCPAMGQAGTPFGRNIPLSAVRHRPDRLFDPDPLEISAKLLARRTFIPAGVNLLATAWIQFMLHDWADHQTDDEHLLEAPPDRGPGNGRPTMRVGRTLPDPHAPAGSAQFPNTVTHWWDASQLYGSDLATQNTLRVRPDGKLRVDDADPELLPVDPRTGTDLTGFTRNWWIGLSLMHTLFAREHNAICDRLRRRYPNWSDEALFARARLINVALMAKIHTLEWTTAILDHPTVHAGMRGNWWGLAGETVHRLVGRVSDSDEISGIPGSPMDHHGVPYSITEEFVAVYRMHPLLPDRIEFWSAGRGEHVKTVDLSDTTEGNARKLLGDITMADVTYSFGLQHSGQLTLDNYPETLRRLQSNGRELDLAAVDILRDRERGLPRYNEFRRLLHRPAVRSFHELSPAHWRRLAAVYPTVDDVDLMVGLLAETPPRGFGFSDTAFRIFILMSARRLKSDRFFTTDYTPDVYTPEGIAWIENNTMRSILRRHFGDRTLYRLHHGLDTVKNVFQPWSADRPGPV